MSINASAISDAELRELLNQHGFPNQPVTSTTRNVLISRLRKKMAEGSAKGRQTTKHLARYSSAEEESDRETTMTSRNTLAGSNTQSTMPPPAAASKRKRATTHGSFSLFSPSITSSTVGIPASSSSNTLPTIKVPIQSRNSVFIPPPIVHSSDTEESDSGGTGNSNSRNRANPYLSYGRLSGLSFPKRYSPQLDTPPRTSQFGNNNGPSIRQRPANSSEAHSRLSDTNNSSSGAEDSPYVSDFTKRLLQFRDRNLAQQQQDSPVTDRRTIDSRPVLPPNTRYFYRPRFSGEVVHQAPESRSSSSLLSGSISKPGRAAGSFGDFIARLDQQYGFKQTLVPFVLLGALVLFFAFLVFMYLTISPDLVSTITAQSAKYTLCAGDEYSTENCIFENDIDLALDFLRIIVPELQQRVERHMCKDPGLPFMLPAIDAAKMRVNTLMNHDEYDTQRQLLNMEYLIDLNPQWHISNLNAEGLPITIEEVRQLHPTQTNAFGILKPRLPLTCLFLRKLQTFFFVVGALGLGSVLFYLGNMFYKYRAQQKHERSQKLNRIISQILQIVMEQASTFPRNAEAAAVVVNHLRDKIIEPSQRTKELEGLWREAIAFLEHNESRVQFEVGTRNGEECKLVRWVHTIQTPPRVSVPSQQHAVSAPLPPTSLGPPVGNGTPHTSTNLYNSTQLSKIGEAMLTAKKWQSPAFDNAYKIVSPPTPCLKIRQMFDKYEAVNPNLKTIISDAILEKVGPTCKVYDIKLDKQSCCVYVRCATAKDAGMVHDEINGWWFDNRLVSIKFLRLERFMDRFPDSVNNRHLLRPSNPEKLSLTQCHSADGGRFGEEDDDEDMDDEMHGDDE